MKKWWKQVTEEIYHSLKDQKQKELWEAALQGREAELYDRNWNGAMQCGADLMALANTLMKISFYNFLKLMRK